MTDGRTARTISGGDTLTLLVGPNGSGRAQVSADGVTRTLALSPAAPRIARDYRVEGSAQAFDAAGRAWLARQIADMNASLSDRGSELLRPWIVSFPYHEGRLLPGPSNLYFHHG